MASIPHDPNAVLEYGWDYTSWLESDETIDDAVWTISPTGEGALVKSTVHDESITDGKCVVWLQGGVVGVVYSATCHITTSAGRQDDRTLKIRVKQR